MGVHSCTWKRARECMGKRPDNWDPSRFLIAAIIRQAAVDAQSSNPRLAREARDWLQGYGIEFAAALELHPEWIRSWLASQTSIG